MNEEYDEKGKREFNLKSFIVFNLVVLTIFVLAIVLLYLFDYAPLSFYLLPIDFNEFKSEEDIFNLLSGLMSVLFPWIVAGYFYSKEKYRINGIGKGLFIGTIFSLIYTFVIDWMIIKKYFVPCSDWCGLFEILRIIFVSGSYLLLGIIVYIVGKIKQKREER